MKELPGHRPPLFDCLSERPSDLGGWQAVTDWPANNFTTEQVQDNRQVNPASRGWQVSDVGNPVFVWSICFEFLVEEIRGSLPRRVCQGTASRPLEPWQYFRS